MPNYKVLQLKAGKEKAILRKHPWIFSGALHEPPVKPEEGELIEIHDRKGRVMCSGFYQKGTIAVKILEFGTLGKSWLKNKVTSALEYRRNTGLFDLKDTNCCRLIFAEGDSLPGLIVDKYADTAVVQIHHNGWFPFLKELAAVLTESGIVKNVFHKANTKLGNSSTDNKWISGESSQNTVTEYGHRFIIDWAEGQKTGFFLDQRENRAKLGKMSKGKRVLNTFSYTGGFSIYALKGGAEAVTSVDISAPATELALENASLNEVAEKHSAEVADVFNYLEHEAADYDIIILDPPAFSKSRRTTHNAMQGYKRLNRLAIEKIKPGGIIFTFSCSQHISPSLFEDTIRAAAIEAGRAIRLTEKLGQPADHPVNMFHPEGEYLKGLILCVE